MSVDPFEQWIGGQMVEEDIEGLLDSVGWGILALANDDVPYSLPISFGYDGEAIYFAFIRSSPTDTKFEYIEDGKPARLLVTDVDSRLDWQSVSVAGTVTSVKRDSPEWLKLLDSLDDNAWFSSDFRFATMSKGLQGYQLEIDELYGIEF